MCIVPPILIISILCNNFYALLKWFFCKAFHIRVLTFVNYHFLCHFPTPRGTGVIFFKHVPSVMSLHRRGVVFKGERANVPNSIWRLPLFEQCLLFHMNGTNILSCVYNVLALSNRSSTNFWNLILMFRWNTLSLDHLHLWFLLMNRSHSAFSG